MPYTVGAEDSFVQREIPVPDGSGRTRQLRRAEPPLHAVEVNNLDGVAGNGETSGIAVCGVDVYLFREVWPSAVIPSDACEECWTAAGRG